MCLIAMLIMIAIVLLIFVVAVGVMGGATFIVIFSDVIVCIAIIAYIVRLILKRHKK